jgi:glyoxylase-like metal-dependent hydrolase (beta-lactamase superfamily II)
LKIVDGIHQVEGVNCNVYLVEDGDKLILIDTGLPRSDKKIMKYVESLGRKPSDVAITVITHFHIDHVGSLKKVLDATGSKVAVGEFDAEIVAGKKAPPKPKNLLFRAASSFIKLVPIEPNIVLKEGDKIGGLTVILTSGHSEGSISLLDTQRKAMFVGDALRFVNDKLTESPEKFNLDSAEARESIGKISTFNFEVMLAGHGNPLMPDASQKVKEFYAKLKQ